MEFRHRIAAAVVLLAAVVAAPAHAQVTFNSVTLSWTTPGDDGAVGKATSFDLRYSTSPITATNFEAATRWTTMPIPGTSGVKQTVTVTGLSPTTTYYFAIKTADEVPNWAPISNIAQATTTQAPDNLRPAPLALSITASTDTSATLGWTAVGDDSLTGTAASYDIRFSTAPITAANFATATQAPSEPTPGPAGTSQSLVIRDLTRQTTYYFAAKATDDAGNVSALSNVPSVTTPDTMAPAAIRDLAIGWLFMGWHGIAGLRERSIGID